MHEMQIRYRTRSKTQGILYGLSVPGLFLTVSPMTNSHTLGELLSGDLDTVRRSVSKLNGIPVDWDLMETSVPLPRRNQTTIREPVSVVGPGTFLRKNQCRITFKPTDQEGWWFDRTDQANSLPVGVAIHNVWNTGDVVSNIVLRSGSPHNYIRLVEHIIALRLGTSIDNLLIEMDSGDPPLFERGSMDLVEALEKAGSVETNIPVSYVTVKEPVTVGGPRGSFLTIRPADPDRPTLTLDCAVCFKTAIGRQRIQFPVQYEHFRYGAEARTNTSSAKMLFCRTLGKLFADIRNLGYTDKNVLIAGRWWYYNKPKLIHNGKSLEAVWHRATLDLLAALALIDRGRLAGHVTSYKAGHRLDVEMVRQLYQRDLLVAI